MRAFWIGQHMVQNKFGVLELFRPDGDGLQSFVIFLVVTSLTTVSICFFFVFFFQYYHKPLDRISRLSCQNVLWVRSQSQNKLHIINEIHLRQSATTWVILTWFKTTGQLISALGLCRLIQQILWYGLSYQTTESGLFNPKIILLTTSNLPSARSHSGNQL